MYKYVTYKMHNKLCKICDITYILRLNVENIESYKKVVVIKEE